MKKYTTVVDKITYQDVSVDYSLEPCSNCGSNDIELKYQLYTTQSHKCGGSCKKCKTYAYGQGLHIGDAAANWNKHNNIGNLVQIELDKIKAAEEKIKSLSKKPFSLQLTLF